MNIWSYDGNKYVAEATFALEKARFDLSFAKMDMLKLENQLAAINYHLNLSINNIRALRKAAVIVNIEEFRKIQRESVNLRNQRELGKKMLIAGAKTLKQMEERIGQLVIALEKLHNNILELPNENKRS